MTPERGSRVRVLVTGGAGFIGSAVVRRLATEADVELVVNVDALTYAGNLDSLREVADRPAYRFERLDICEAEALRRAFETYAPDAVIHLAAESHVDRSIDGPGEFVRTNVVGTFTLLQEARRHWETLPAGARARFRFVHVSTDEVFGSLGETGQFTEETPYQPNSPYSASKAGSDHLVRAWHHTYGFPAITTNCSNNYGPFQFPEKLIPLMIVNALEGKPLPVYGDGQNVRDWLYVGDHCGALREVLARGEPGGTYNVGGNAEMRNLDVVQTLCAILARERPGRDYASQITFVRDRPGHDRRYAIDATKIRRELGWTPAQTFASGLERTVRWYLANPEWVASVTSGDYRRWMSQQYA